MKYNKILMVLALAAFSALNFSCREKELISDDVVIPGLGGSDIAQTELDKWLYRNFTIPYNVEVKYKWDASDMITTITRKLVPVEEEYVEEIMEAIKKVWFEPYEKTAGVNFLKEMAPKNVVLVGSPEYQNGTIKLGQAEGAKKIILLNMNNAGQIFRDQTSTADEIKYGLQYMLNTIEHEFAHILHQTVMFDQTFQAISASNYIPDNWHNVTVLADAYRMGFVSPYAMSGKDEDFVEMIARIMVYGIDWFENTVIATASASTVNPNAAADLREKLSIVEKYMLETWGVLFLDDPITREKGIVTYVQEAINEVVQGIIDNR